MDIFVDHAVSCVEPNWQPGLLGAHTFNTERGFTVIDGRRRRRFR